MKLCAIDVNLLVAGIVALLASILPGKAMTAKLAILDTMSVDSSIPYAVSDDGSVAVGYGHLDLALANGYRFSDDNDVAVLLGRGDGTFATPVRYPAPSVFSPKLTAGDVDSDGWIDLVALGDHPSVVRNQHDGTFSPSSPITIVADAQNLVLENIRGDDRPELIVVSQALNAVLVYDNRSPGDSNGDGVFNQLDVVAVLQHGKYLTGDLASWPEGDWNGDAVFDQLDPPVA